MSEPTEPQPTTAPPAPTAATPDPPSQPQPGVPTMNLLETDVRSHTAGAGMPNEDPHPAGPPDK